MATRSILLGLATTTVLLGGCATQPASSPSAGMQPGGDASLLLEKKFQEAARTYRRVEKNGRTLYCRHEKVIGSTIPTTQCLTETQLRLQVENMEELRDRVRVTNRCALQNTGGGGRGCSGH